MLLGTNNVAADRALRVLCEWELDETTFESITAYFFRPQIDLFASWLNHQLPRYAAWQPDPGAEREREREGERERRTKKKKNSHENGEWDGSCAGFPSLLFTITKQNYTMRRILVVLCSCYRHVLPMQRTVLPSSLSASFLMWIIGCVWWQHLD